MSLLDALLLEPYRDPREIWIALRTDGQRGSGTVDDPYDGTMRLVPARAATLVYDPQKVWVLTDEALGFSSPPEQVKIEGVAGPAGDYLNGTFSISDLDASGRKFYYTLPETAVPTSLPVGLNALGLNGLTATKLHATQPRTAGARLFWPVVEVTTTEPHGLLAYDAAQISNTNEPLFQGSFSIVEAGSNWFRYCLNGVPSSGASESCAWASFLFPLDDRLRKAPRYAVIHLGPGEFLTRGYTPGGARSWQPKAGQKFRGSGLGVTTLKLVHASAPGRPYWAIGADYNAKVHYFEASNFTVDCNLPGQPLSPGGRWAEVACGAIDVPGSHTHLRRIRAIHWGSQSLGVECFVLNTGGAHPHLPEVVNCVIEDCTVERPSGNNLEGHTCIAIGGGGSGGMYHRGCVVRNCVVDCAVRENDVPIESIVVEAGPLGRVRTRWPHGRNTGDWITVSGAAVLGNPINPFNGSFEVKDRTGLDDYTLRYALTSTPDAAPSGPMMLGRAPSHFVRISSISPQTDLKTVLLETATPHYRRPGEIVGVAGIGVVEGQNPFNGAFVVQDVPSPTKLEYVMGRLCHPNAQPSGGVIGAYYNGAGVAGGRAGITEGNHVRGAHVGVYQDTHSSRHMVVRRNHWSNVRAGFYNFKTDPQKLGPVDWGTPFHGSALTYEFTSGQHRAVFHSLLPHGLQSPYQATMQGAVVQESYSNAFNRTFELGGVLNNAEFWYSLGNLSAPPATNAEASPVYRDVLAANSLARDPADHRIAIFKAINSLNFQDNDWVVVFGAILGESIQNPYNGVFRVFGVNSGEKSFKYLMVPLPEQAPSADPDPASSPKCAKQLGAALRREGTLASFQSVRLHQLAKEDAIRIAGALNSDGTTINNPFNGYFAIESVPLPNVANATIRYRMQAEPSANAYGAPLFYEVWQVGQMLIEDNVIELTPITGDAAVIGLGLAADSLTSPHIFKELVLRGNLMAPSELAVENPAYYRGYAVRVDSLRYGLIEGNVIDLPLDDADPNKGRQMRHDASQAVKFFDNQRPDGRLLRGESGAAGRLDDELSTLIEDSMTMALL